MIGANNKRDIFLLCIAMGAGFRLLVWVAAIGLLLVWDSPYTTIDYIVSVPNIVMWGVYRGVFWSAFAIPLLRRKPMRRALRLLLLVVTPFALFSGCVQAFWMDPNRSELLAFIYDALPTVAVILTCIYARAAFPNIAFGASQCQHCGEALTKHCLKCGYNLTGNVSGVCPECGEAV